MIKNIYQLICFLRNKHSFVTAWNNQHGFGWYCKCGVSVFTHNKQLDYIKNGKNLFK
jgi:hypothetical protein